MWCGRHWRGLTLRQQWHVPRVGGLGCAASGSLIWRKIDNSMVIYIYIIYIYSIYVILFFTILYYIILYQIILYYIVFYFIVYIYMYVIVWYSMFLYVICVYIQIFYVYIYIYICMYDIYIYTHTYVSYYIYHMWILTTLPRCQCRWLVGGDYSYISFVKFSQRYEFACLPWNWQLMTYLYPLMQPSNLHADSATRRSSLHGTASHISDWSYWKLNTRYTLQPSIENVHHETSETELKQRV